jgi:hypothetical protein
MTQINFRIDDSIKLILEIVAKEKGKSVAQLAKESLLKEIEPIRIELAFELLKEGKIGRKKAWKISGLDYPGFLHEWKERNAEENITSDSIEDESKLIEELIHQDSYKKYLKNN